LSETKQEAQAVTNGGRASSGGFDREACVIGAGPAGLASAKALVDRGMDFDWFEKGSMVGGLWRIDNDNGGAAAYETLHLNSSRPLTQFPSHPMPEDWPDYPSHELMARYFQDFADSNRLTERVTFNTEVQEVEPVEGPGRPGEHGWRVTTPAGTRTYSCVFVSNGHHSEPRIPEFPGEFTGESFHAHEYITPEVFEGKDVLVISVSVVTRHGVHVLPKYAFGRPIDQFGTPVNAWIPFRLERRVYEIVQRFSTGRPEDRGLPRPDHRLLSAHPTVSSEFCDRVGHGDIDMKPGIERLGGKTVHFVDGTSIEVDTLVYATGYTVSLPFFDPDLYDPADNAMPLYQRVLTPELPGLFFIGFVQTVGSNIPLMELQAEWTGDLVTSTCVLPPEDEMREWIASDQAAMKRRYVRSARHTMQVDFWRYANALKLARMRGAGRAAQVIEKLPKSVSELLMRASA
jgi:hypothetical protein